MILVVMVITVCAFVPAMAKDRLEQIKEKGYIEFCTEPYWAPNEFIDPGKTGDEQYVGSDIELAKMIAEKLGVELKINPLDFSAVLLGSFCVFLWFYKIDIIKVLVSPANKYITDLPNVIMLLSLALFLLSLNYYLCKKIGSSKFMEFMLRISTFIIPFYLLQWVIIAWVFYLLNIFGAPAGCFNIGIYAASVVAVTAICIFVTIKFGMKIMKLLLKITSFKKRKPKKKEAK